MFMEMVIHARFAHLVETIDITNTELEEVRILTFMDGPHTHFVKYPAA